MLQIRPLPIAAPEASEKALETVLFGLPLPGGLACGTCTRFKCLDPLFKVSGRCKRGIKPGIINRATTACGLHRAKGAPAEVDGRAVRA